MTFAINPTGFAVNPWYCVDPYYNETPTSQPDKCQPDKKPPATRLTVAQIADELDVTGQTVRNWMKTGLEGVILKSHKRGGKRFILRDDLDSFLSETTHEGFEEKEQDRTPTQFKKDQLAAKKAWDKFSSN